MASGTLTRSSAFEVLSDSDVGRQHSVQEPPLSNKAPLPKSPGSLPNVLAAPMCVCLPSPRISGDAVHPFSISD